MSEASMNYCEIHCVFYYSDNGKEGSACSICEDEANQSE